MQHQAPVACLSQPPPWSAPLTGVTLPPPSPLTTGDGQKTVISAGSSLRTPQEAAPPGRSQPARITSTSGRTTDPQPGSKPT